MTYPLHSHLDRPLPKSVPLTLPLFRRLQCYAALGLVYLAMIAARAAFAQAATGSVEGRVQNELSGAMLESVQVSIKGTSLVTSTDTGGFFRLSGVPAGPIVLRVVYTGLDEQSIGLTVPAGGVVQQDVKLTSRVRYGADAQTVKLDAFVVQSKKETDAATIAINEQRFSRNIVSVVSADEYGTILDTNPGELLKNLPGMDVEYFGGTIVAVSVRGLGSENTEIAFDGMPTASANAENVSRGFEMQHASAADVARVEVRRVPLPEDSANSVGGSVNFIRKSAFEKSKREISYWAALQSDGDWLTLQPMDGPKDRLIDRWRPNWRLSWTEPINRDLGFALTVGQTDAVTNVRWSTPSWSIGSAANYATALAAINAGQPIPKIPSLFNPAYQTAGFSNAPYWRGSKFADVRVDWRPIHDLTTSWSANFNDNWKQEIEETRFRINAAATGSGDVTRYNDQTMSLGRVGGGTARHENIKWRDHGAPAFNTTFTSRWKKGNWEISGKGTWAWSKHTYSDTAHGFFESASVSGNGVDGLTTPGQLGVGAGTANPIPLTVDFYGLTYMGAPARVDVRTTANGLPSTNIADYTVPVDWQNAANWRLGAASSRPGRSKEIVTAYKVYTRYTFDFRNPIAAQFGYDFTERFRDRDYIFNAWTFVGADGIPNSADDRGDQIAFVNAGPRPDPLYHYITPQRVSMSRYYKLYQDHPNWFVYDPERSARLGLTNNSAYQMTERTYAPYVELDGRFFGNRLRVTGGVRRELVNGSGQGLLTDRNNAYMKYADGSVVHLNDATAPGPDGVFGNSDDVRLVRNLGTSSAVNYQLLNPASVLPVYRGGAPVFTPAIQAGGNALNAAARSTDTNTNVGRASLAYTNAVYRRLGSSGQGTSQKYFPSVHLTFNITENLTFQAAYAFTMAKPNLQDAIIPADDLSDDPITSGNGAGAVGRLTVTNPNLKPWTADEYDFRLAYFTQSGGTIALGWARHNISNFQAQVDTAPLTAEDLPFWQALFPDKEIGPSLIGYSIRTSFNEGNSRLETTDIEGRQSLDRLLPRWAKGFYVGGSLSYTNRAGAHSGDLGRNRRWRGTANVAYNARKWSARVNYTMNGELIENDGLTNSAAPGIIGQQVLLRQDIIDVQASYRLTHWAELFASAGNVTDELRIREQQMPGRPKWGSMTSSSTLGKFWALGVQGKF
jgi:TonB-dependent receptor